MPEELQDENKKSSKEMWLFLIFVDLIALCVFGFFIYNSFFAGMLGIGEEETNPNSFVEEVMIEDVVIPEEIKPARPASQSKNQPQSQQPAPATKPAEQQHPKPGEVNPAPTTQPQPKPVTAEPAREKAKRQSVFVSGSGKTRKVTFKYYGEAKYVAVVGGFTMRKPVAMKKTGNEWRVDVVVYPGDYRYMYVIDGKEIPDPNGTTDGGRSVLSVK